MTVSIGSNISSLFARRYLGTNTDAVSRISERLASGSRINRASDDAAGLAISSSLTSAARVYTQGIRNINDGISALGIAEGGLSGLTDIGIRIRELATQSANGTFSRIQRLSLDGEADELVAEFNRMINTTSFNGIGLLNLSLSELRIQGGYGIDGGIGFGLNGSLSRSIGTRTFSSSSTASSGATSTLADMNGDGNLDYVGASNTQSKVVVAYGNGDGTFQAGIDIATSGTINSVTVGDFNGDGRMDIAAGRATANQIDIRLQNGSGGFSVGTAIATSAFASRLAVADLDNDGRSDIIGSVGSTITSFLGNGNGTFGAGLALATTGIAREITIGDFNGDGKSDVGYVTAGSQVGILHGLGTGGFSLAQSFTVAGVRGISAADVNDDGVLDLVTGNSGSTSIQLYLGNSNGTFGNPTTLTQLAVGQSVQFGDMDGDGNVDIAAGESVLYGNGDGTFQAATAASMNAAIVSLTLGDLNNDGVLDIVTSSTSQFTTTLAETSSTTMLQNLSLTSREHALEVMDLIDRTLERISQEKGDIGSIQSRLESAARALFGSRDNALIAASRITDADIAGESAELVRVSLLQRTGAAVLSQANQQPQLALTLLGAI